MICGLIYRAISPSGKSYVGKTISFFKRKSEHQIKANLSNDINYDFKLYRAIRKYGFENFKWEIIEDNIPNEFLNIKECEYIQIFNSYKNGYNMTLGGDGVCGRILSKETKKKISLANLGKKRTKEQKEKFSLSHKNKFHTISTKEKIKINNAKFWLGKNHSEETKMKISLSKKGKKHTIETRIKMSESHKNRKV